MEEKWKETSNRYIAFLDIMGFSDLVYRNKHDYVKKKMEVFTKNLSKLEEVMKLGTEENPDTFRSIRKVIFSDSVLLITPDSTKHSLTSLIVGCEIILANSFECEIPIKGAISYGQITADFEKSLFFGKGLIDAYKLEEQLLFFGIAIDNKVDKKLRIFDISDEVLLLRRKIPTKSGKIFHNIINWGNVIEGLFDNKTQLQMLEKLYENMSGHPRLYLDNSIEIYS